MKNKIFNVFYRILKNRVLARFFTNIAYGILLIYYKISKMFCRSDYSYVSQEEARENIESISKKPEESTACSNIIVDEGMDLSIIVPAYNVEKYIEECVLSIINQKTQYKYEAIIVNDGSTDNTRNILEKYSDYRELKIINQENGGISVARNTALNIATGRYIMFVDSDDVLTDGSIEKLMKRANDREADIVQGSYYEFFDDNNKYYYDIKPCEIDNSINKQDLKMPGFPWGKVIKSELFRDVRFPVNCWYEDTIITYLVGQRCSRYIAINDYVYGYRKNYNSVTYTSKKSVKVLDTYWVMEIMIDELKRLGIEINEVTYYMMIGQLSTILYRRIRNLNEEIIKNTFICACYIYDKIKFASDGKKPNNIFRDLEKSFETRNYKLWKLCSNII